MYKSPILIAVDELHRDFVKKQDDYIFLTIEKALKCEVNREELLKALAYDRDQYDKGFRDGRAYKPPIETNYDRIVGKSPEELATFQSDRGGCPPNDQAQNITGCKAWTTPDNKIDETCRACWLEYLKREVDE